MSREAQELPVLWFCALQGRGWENCRKVGSLGDGGSEDRDKKLS